MIDAHYDKVRVEDRVITLALMIAHGVNGNGSREILAVEPMFDESEDSWRAFFQKLKKRGLRRVGLCISDAHAGIQAAVKKELLGRSWQRCKVHFMRNILGAEVPHKEKAPLRGPSETDLAPAGQEERPAGGGTAGPGIRGSFSRRHPLSRGRARGLAPVLQLSGDRSQEDLVDEHVGANRSGRSGAGAGWSGSSPRSSPGSGWTLAISWNTRKTGRPIGAISNGRRSRRPWNTTGSSWQHRQQAEESYMMAPKLRTPLTRP